MHLDLNMTIKIGFPKDARFRFRINGRHCRVNADGVATIERLIELHKASLLAEKPTWLLAHRDTIREIESLNYRGVLSLIVERTSDPKLRLLAIWLRGRCGGYMGTSILKGYATSPDFQIRKETIRALRRLSAWTLLAEVAKNDSNARIRRLAAPVLAKPHLHRLMEFAKNVHPIHVNSTTPPLWISPEIRRFEGKRPKSVLLIRQTLERIRALVTGNAMKSKTQ